MDEKEPPPAFMSALTTEHFVLQGALSANTGEVGTRASLYIFSLSSSLVDSNLEGILFLNAIARIRKYYRTLAPEAEEQFSAESGRWPENQAWPALQMGPFVGFITTTASMVAFINSIVAGVGVAFLAGRLLGEKQTLLASLIGAGVALVLMAAFFAYQKWRYDSTS
jgi:hypothetical protein